MKLTPNHAKVDRYFAEPVPQKHAQIVEFKPFEVKMPSASSNQLPQHEEMLVRANLRTYIAVLSIDLEKRSLDSKGG